MNEQELQIEPAPTHKTIYLFVSYYEGGVPYVFASESREGWSGKTDAVYTVQIPYKP